MLCSDHSLGTTTIHHSIFQTPSSSRILCRRRLSSCGKPVVHCVSFECEKAQTISRRNKQNKKLNAKEKTEVSNENENNSQKRARRRIHPVVASLKLCANQKDLVRGAKIHADVLKRGLFEKDIYIGNSLVNMYAKCGALSKAQQVFDKLPVRDVVSWNVIISGYSQHNRGREALQLYERMKREGFTANATTFACVLKACGAIGAIDKGQKFHKEILREGLLEKNVIVGNALVDMYAKCGEFAKARDVFDDLPIRDVVSWNALIGGYAEHGLSREAMDCFERMHEEGLSPDAATFVYMLRAYGSVGALYKGQDLHAEIVKQGLSENNVIVGTALVDMYAKCGKLTKAQEVFDQLPVQDVVSWNVLIAAYVENGESEQALKCFQRTQQKGVSPNAATFVCTLKACGDRGLADIGQEIHAKILKDGFSDTDLIIGTALLDMYAKCGELVKAKQVFDKLMVRDVVAWTALITGYAQQGMDKHVCDSFEEMLEQGIKPNLVTFTVVLNACSHSGLLDKGQKYFEIMSRRYGITPNEEHHTCMIHLFGRAGHFHKALSMIKNMPSCDYLPVWLALLDVCKVWGNVKLGRWAFERAVQLNGKDPAAYICMSNIYASASMVEEVKEIEAMRMKHKAWKGT